MSDSRVRICLVKFDASTKPLKQGQIVACTYESSTHFEQCGHMNGFSPLCVRCENAVSTSSLIFIYPTLTIWIVNELEMAKVLPHPGCSHLNGSSNLISPLHAVCGTSKLTLLRVSPHMSSQRSGLAKALIALWTDERFMTDMALKMPQDLLSRSK